MPCRAEVGSAADALFAATLSGLYGRPVRLAQCTGESLLVDFRARWCPPCRVEIPERVKLAAAMRRQGLEVRGIAVEDKGEAVGDFASDCDIDYRLPVAGEHGVPLMQALGNTKSGLPFTMAVDRRGPNRRRHARRDVAGRAEGGRGGGAALSRTPQAERETAHPVVPANAGIHAAAVLDPGSRPG